jgi:hypothetical protein
VKDRPLDDIGIYDADDDDFDEEDELPLPPGYGPDLGPDEHDIDLLDGSWEQRYCRGEARGRDWNTIGIGIALLLLLAIVLPGILAITR